MCCGLVFMLQDHFWWPLGQRVRALASGVFEKTLGHPSFEDKSIDSGNSQRQNCFLQRGTEFQQGSESTAGDPSALPLNIVMQPEAGLAGSLG